jgi:hypothetical protein
VVVHKTHRDELQEVHRRRMEKKARVPRHIIRLGYERERQWLAGKT